MKNYVWTQLGECVCKCLSLGDLLPTKKATQTAPKFILDYYVGVSVTVRVSRATTETLGPVFFIKIIHEDMTGKDFTKYS